MSLEIKLPTFDSNLQPGSWLGFYDTGGDGKTKPILLDPNTASTTYKINGSSNSKAIINTNYGGAIVVYDALGEVNDNWVLFKLPGADDPNVFGTTTSITASSAISAPTKCVLANSNSALTATLPSAKSYKDTRLTIKKTDGGNAVTISGTVDGVSNPTLEAVGEAVDLISDGANWHFLSDHRSFQSVSVSTSVVRPVRTVLADSSGGAITITLPLAADYKGWDVKIKQEAGTNTVVNGAGAETIDGSGTYTLVNTYASVTVFSDGSKWHVTGEYAS